MIEEANYERKANSFPLACDGFYLLLFQPRRILYMVLHTPISKQVLRYMLLQSEALEINVESFVLRISLGTYSFEQRRIPAFHSFNIIH